MNKINVNIKKNNLIHFFYFTYKAPVFVWFLDPKSGTLYTGGQVVHNIYYFIFV